MNNGITTVVDMGYLMYSYAFNRDIWYCGEYEKYTILSGCVLADENWFSYRKDKNIHYKENRKQHKFNETHIIARNFWREQRETGSDNGLEILSLYGAEGDDIVALLFLQYGLRIVGIDKDYYQLPDLKMKNTRGIDQGIKKERLPKTLYHLGWDNKMWLLHLAINGDISDNVPRLTPKGRKGLQIEADILASGNPINEAFSRFGGAFLDNLYEVILPYPRLINSDITPWDVYQLCVEKKWYDYVKTNAKKIMLPNLWSIYGGGGENI